MPGADTRTRTRPSPTRSTIVTRMSPASSTSRSRSLPVGPHQRLPAAVAGGLEQQHLGRAARGPPRAHAHRQHPRVVHDQQVAGRKLPGEVAGTAGGGSRRRRGHRPAVARCHAAPPRAARSAQEAARRRDRWRAWHLEAFAVHGQNAARHEPSRAALDLRDLDAAAAPVSVRRRS